jgi:membrane protein implicated in regulation of membrane protease activity
MSWVSDHPALAWLALALVLGAIEVATLSLVFLMLALGAVGAAVAAALGAGGVVQVVVAVVVALLLLGLLRPALAHRGRSGPDMLTGAAALVGREARVLDTVTDAGGRVRLRGEVWSARSAGAESFLPGQTVRVVTIEGATAVVDAGTPQREGHS